MNKQQFDVMQEGDTVQLTCGGPIGSAVAFVPDKNPETRGLIQFYYAKTDGKIETATLPYTVLTPRSGQALSVSEPGFTSARERPAHPERVRRRDR